MRLIDADALIAKYGDLYAEEWPEKGFIGTIRGTIRGLVDSMPTIEPESQWIPCSERLPERGKDVLVTRDYDGREDFVKSRKYVEVAACYGEDGNNVWVSFSDEYKAHPKNHAVIAWMPLPEPYNEDTKNETD